jgi:hypothetical protein
MLKHLLILLKQIWFLSLGDRLQIFLDRHPVASQRTLLLALGLSSTRLQLSGLLREHVISLGKPTKS